VIAVDEEPQLHVQCTCELCQVRARDKQPFSVRNSALRVQRRTRTLPRPGPKFRRPGVDGRVPCDLAAQRVVQAKHLSGLLSTPPSFNLPSCTTRGILTLAGSILNFAVTRGYRADNPVNRLSKTEKPKAKNKTKARVLDVDQIAALIKHTLPTYRPLIITAVYTGLRQSELLGLRWRDIDFDESKIRVRHQMSRAKKSAPAKILPLKSDAGERDLDLTPELAKVLARISWRVHTRRTTTSCLRR